MKNAIKKSGKRVFAYRLGEGHPEIGRLIAEGRLIPHGDSFEVMSQEAVRGGSGKGQTAHWGDYIKIDSLGYPYPNSAEYFVSNHRHIEGDEYEQIPKPLKVWTVSEPMCEEIEYLQREKGLVIDTENEEKCFTAPLWGTVESAARDDVLVIHRVKRDETGSITDMNFNFVCLSEFIKNYTLTEEE